MSAVGVTTAAQSARADQAAIAAGTPSFTLMQRAADAAVARICAQAPVPTAAAVFVGGGNNGGDGWLVAQGLRSRGCDVRVQPVATPRTPDALRARDSALAGGAFAAPHGDEPLIVDALLGTGQRVPLDATMVAATDAIHAAEARGARVIALDVPTGVADAGDGIASIDPHAVRASATITFGSCKRVLLAARAHAGAIEVVDIGLGDATRADDVAHLVDATFVQATVPPISHAAHKGARGRLAIIGGAEGMVGAVILAARAALASGIGLVRCLVDPRQLGAVHAALPEALVAGWPTAAAAFDELVGGWATAIAIGPGLGRGTSEDALVARALESPLPVLVDADALAALRPGAPRTATTLLTPHPGEAAAMLARIPGAVPLDARAVDERRDQVAGALQSAFGATVLLKGVPTVVHDGVRRGIIARGTSALATGGSGDVLTGIAGTLLAQGLAASAAGGCAAWVHGVAAEHATSEAGGVRGTTLAHVLAVVPRAWPRERPSLPEHVLAMLPAPPT